MCLPIWGLCRPSRGIGNIGVELSTDPSVSMVMARRCLRSRGPGLPQVSMTDDPPQQHFLIVFQYIIRYQYFTPKVIGF